MRQSLRRVFLLCLCLSTAGCIGAWGEVKQEKAVSEITRAHAMAYSTRAQLTALREEMAGVRIQAAKIKADNLALRHQVKKLQRELVTFGKHRTHSLEILQVKEKALEQLREEQARLVHDKAVLEATLAQTPAALHTKASRDRDTAPFMRRLTALEASVQHLNRQLGHLSQVGMTGQRTVQAMGVASGPKDGHAHRATLAGPAVMTLTMSEADTREIVIQRGDTVSQLAEQFGMTGAALRAANGIDGDLILEGDTVIVPSPQKRN